MREWVVWLSEVADFDDRNKNNMWSKPRVLKEGQKI
jgi:hypothetical protein